MIAHDEKGKRTDTHRPSALDPANYELASPLDGKVWYQAGPWIDGGRVGHTCNHCGHSLRYYVRHVYKPTGEVVIFGEDCTKLIGLADSRSTLEFNKLRERARKDEREAKLAMEKEQRKEIFAKQYPELVEFFEDHDMDTERFYFVNEMHRALIFFGYLTTGQADAMRRTLVKRQEMAAKQLEDAVNAPEADAPSGKHTVAGIVVSSKVEDGLYGPQRKMLVKLDDGNKVWGSMPASIIDGIREHYGYTEDAFKGGVRVSFSANFTVSNNDSHFSYYKRPTQGKVTK